jgi:hypothetical protein
MHSHSKYASVGVSDDDVPGAPVRRCEGECGFEEVSQ